MLRSHLRKSWCRVLLAAGFSMLAASAHAASPKVTIDIGTAVECHDVSAPEFAVTHPNDKIVEGTFRLSVLLKAGDPDDLEELHLMIDSSEGLLRVVDFRPRTELASEVTGEVEVSSSADNSRTFNASIGGLVGQLGPRRSIRRPAPRPA